MASTKLYILNHLEKKANDAETFLGKAMDCKDKVWSILVTHATYAQKQKLTKGNFVVIHNAIMTPSTIKITGEGKSPTKIFLTNKFFDIDREAIINFYKAPERSIPEIGILDEYERVSVRAKIADVSPIKSDTNWTRRDVTLIQEKQKISLQLWGDKQNLVDQSNIDDEVFVQTVSVHKYKQTTSLNSKQETEIQIVKPPKTEHKVEDIIIVGYDDTDNTIITEDNQIFIFDSDEPVLPNLPLKMTVEINDGKVSPAEKGHVEHSSHD